MAFMSHSQQGNNLNSSFRRSILKKSNCSDEESPDKPVRNVLFSHQTKVSYVPTLDEFSMDELLTCWFEGGEYKQIKANNKILIRMMETGSLQEDAKHCFRGLEFKTARASSLRRSCKIQAAMNVFSEQSRQMEEDALDSEKIREVYRSIARESQDRAYRLALQDAIVARQYLEGAQNMNESGKLHLDIVCGLKQPHSDSPSKQAEDSEEDDMSLEDSNSIKADDSLEPHSPQPPSLQHKGLRSIYGGITCGLNPCQSENQSSCVDDTSQDDLSFPSDSSSRSTKPVEPVVPPQPNGWRFMFQASRKYRAQ